MKPFLSAAQSILAICLLASFSCIPKQPAAKDADRDGLVDAHETITWDDTLVVLDNDGSGGLTETARRSYGAGNWPAYRFGAGDLDRDGVDEVVLPVDTGTTGFLDVHPRSATGGLGAVNRIPFGEPSYLGPSFAAPVVGDLTNDDRNDLLVTDGAGDLLVFVGDGSGMVRRSLSSWERTAWGGRKDLAIGDFDDNGIVDAMLLDSNLSYFRARSPYAPAE